MKHGIAGILKFDPMANVDEGIPNGYTSVTEMLERERLRCGIVRKSTTDWHGEVAGGDAGARLQASSRQGNNDALHRSRKYLMPINALEDQLAAELPPGYRDWQQ